MKSEKAKIQKILDNIEKLNTFKPDHILASIKVDRQTHEQNFMLSIVVEGEQVNYEIRSDTALELANAILMAKPIPERVIQVIREVEALEKLKEKYAPTMANAEAPPKQSEQSMTDIQRAEQMLGRLETLIDRVLAA